MTIVESAPPVKLRWGEIDDDNNSDLFDFLLPPKQVIGPDIKRGGVDKSLGPDIKRRNEENSVRVTNLSEDTREPDLLELFGAFGHVNRVHVVKDQNTGESRGFGFVNFADVGDAEKAIKKLNGYGYDNQILGVDWATPRAAAA